MTLQPYVSFFVIVLAIILNAVGIMTPNWSVGTEYTMGVWQKCERDVPCYYYNAETETLTDTLRTCQFFAVVSLLLNLGSCLVGFFLVRSNNDLDDGYNNWPLFAFLACIASATSLLILLVVWYFTVHITTNTSVGYSYKLSTASGFGIFLGGLLAFFSSPTN